MRTKPNIFGGTMGAQTTGVRWKAVHAQDVITSLERYLFPALGKVDIRNIRQPQLLRVLEGVEKRGAIETAHRLRLRITCDPSGLLVHGGN